MNWGPGLTTYEVQHMRPTWIQSYSLRPWGGGRGANRRKRVLFVHTYLMGKHVWLLSVPPWNSSAVHPFQSNFCYFFHC